MKRYICLLLFPVVAFSETSTFFCSYTSLSDEKGNHAVTNKFELRFIVDRESKKAYIIGNNGGTEVDYVESNSQISFLEVTPSYSLMTTAIDKNKKSVHSRNTILFGELIPSQYYGYCEIK